MRPKATHTEFRKGTRVHVHMRDGRRISDRFKEKKSGAVILEQNGRLTLSKVRAISIAR